jgi:glutathione peroxidase
VLGFPCNQFGAQEPGSDEEILEFARARYKVNFPMFSKIEVNGDDACELYKFLKSAKVGEDRDAEIAWNFAKFLLNRNGEVVNRFNPRVTPEELDPIIAKLL